MYLGNSRYKGLEACLRNSKEARGARAECLRQMEIRPELRKDCEPRKVNGAIGWHCLLALFVYISFLLST